MSFALFYCHRAWTYTLIFCSLTRPAFQIHSAYLAGVPVATYPTTGLWAKSQRSIFQKGKSMGVATNVYSRKTLEKTKKRSTNFENEIVDDRCRRWMCKKQQGGPLMVHRSHSILKIKTNRRLHEERWTRNEVRNDHGHDSVALQSHLLFFLLLFSFFSPFLTFWTFQPLDQPPLIPIYRKNKYLDHGNLPSVET